MEFGRLELQLWACEIHIFGFGHFGPLAKWVHPKRQLIQHRFETLTFAGRWCLLS